MIDKQNCKHMRTDVREKPWKNGKGMHYEKYCTDCGKHLKFVKPPVAKEDIKYYNWASRITPKDMVGHTGAYNS